MAKRAQSQNGATDLPRRPRGRPRKVVEVRKDNGPDRSRVSAVLAEYTQLDTAGRRINQQKTTLLSNFEKEGGDKAALKAVHRSLALDKGEATAKLEALVRYHAGQDITVRWQADGQSTVMDHLGEAQQRPTPAARAPAPNTQGDRDLAAARAHQDGYNSGLQGAAPSDNPFQHIPGSEQYVRWHDGRDEGQQDRLRRNPGLVDRIAGSATMDPQIPPAPEASPPA